MRISEGDGLSTMICHQHGQNGSLFKRKLAETRYTLREVGTGVEEPGAASGFFFFMSVEISLGS